MHETHATTAERSTAERVHEQFARALDQYVHDPDLHELLTALAADRGLEIPDLTSPGLSEATFMEAAQAILDFRKGQGREAVKNLELSPRSQDALDTVKNNFAMDIDTEPTIQEADAAFVLGGAGKTPRARLDYLLELMESGVLFTDMIVMIGSERKLDLRQNANGLTEIDRAGTAGYNQAGIQAETEFDLMRNTAAAVLDIADEDWELIEGYDLSVPEHHRYQDQYRIAHAEKNGRQVVVISAPMIGEDRLYPDGNRRVRSDTRDGYRMVAEMMREHAGSTKPMHTVAVTDAIFTKFQGADAAATLAEFGIENETIGFTRKHAGLPEWPGGNALYAQEILSALRQTRAARDYVGRSLQKVQ